MTTPLPPPLSLSVSHLNLGGSVKVVGKADLLVQRRVAGIDWIQSKRRLLLSVLIRDLTGVIVSRCIGGRLRAGECERDEMGV